VIILGCYAVLFGMWFLTFWGTASCCSPPKQSVWVSYV